MIPTLPAQVARGADPTYDFSGAFENDGDVVQALPEQLTRVWLLFQNTSSDLMRFTFGTQRLPSDSTGFILNPGGTIGKEQLAVTTDPLNVWAPSRGQTYECNVMLA